MPTHHHQSMCTGGKTTRIQCFAFSIPQLWSNGEFHPPTSSACYIMVFAIQLYKAYYLVGSLYYNYYFSYLPISCL
jgi:hypothetical protein